MRDIFEAELGQLGEDLVALAKRVEVAVQGAGEALLKTDLTVAQAVVDGDEAIDDLAKASDERAVLLLAQQAPVATDLRIVVSAIRMSATLERMGDLAQHVALVARRSYPENALPEAVFGVFQQLQAATERLTSRLVHLLATRDLEVAHAIERDDDIIDLLHQDVFAAQLSSTWQATAQQNIDVTLASRYYERLGDHGVSIARRVIYLVTGADKVS